MSERALSLGIPPGAYPERQDPTAGWLDRQGERIVGAVERAWRVRSGSAREFLTAVEGHGATCRDLDEAGLLEAARDLRARLRREGFAREATARSFALVREAATRTIGERHYPVQVLGGRVLLRGMVAEMETGEGKTLTATLAAGTAALGGIPTHVITVNDYLAARDAEWMGPVYSALGISVGVIRAGMSLDERRAAYGRDVTYCSNKEVAFDYLKDRIVLGANATRVRLAAERLFGGPSRADRVLLRGLCYGIVDEADSVLVDEARTPLIISDRVDDAPEREAYEVALGLARKLVRDEDFELDETDHSLVLTERGSDRLDDLCSPLGGIWTGRHRREDLVRQALTALHVLKLDADYLVRDGRVQIIDEYTGRLMADRAWEHGVHQLVEVKEGVEVTGRQEPRARISYQRFFRRYLRLAGMTGTAREVSRELGAVYDLPVVRLPTNRPLRRRNLGEHVFRTATEKWDAVVERIREIHGRGRPVLVGTRSVEASELLSTRLEKASLPHRVLNARQDRHEAEVIAEAGQPGRITVATNMAGRGTDIRLGDGVADLGGLHVIATERHDARRIDRQLYGRCGRQGDPGTCEMFVSLEDEIFGRYAGPLARRAAATTRLSRLSRLAVSASQRRAERTHARIRRRLVNYDRDLETTLAFSGRGE